MTIIRAHAFFLLDWRWSKSKVMPNRNHKISVLHRQDQSTNRSCVLDLAVQSNKTDVFKTNRYIIVVLPAHGNGPESEEHLASSAPSQRLALSHEEVTHQVPH